MREIRVVFDLDDTLYPERSFALAGFAAAARWARQRLGVVGLEEEMTRLLDEGRLGELFPMALGRYHPGYTEDDLKGLREAYRSNRPTLTLYDDAAHALERLETRGPLGLITDGTLKMQQAKVAGLGIAPHFKAIVYTDALGPERRYFKPHPKAFEIIEPLLGGPGHHFVYVGDNPSKDFVAPRARGWSTVWIERPQRIHAKAKMAADGAPDHVLSSLRDLDRVLGDIAQKRAGRGADT